MSVWFIGDTHFGDKNIIDFAERPFKSVAEMNNALLRGWNSRATENDTVYIVGDFVNPKYDNDTAEIIKKLRGHKILIRGNHDTLTDKEYHELGIEKVYDHPIIFENFYIVSHEPVFLNKSMPYANIFAHVHNNPIYPDCSGRHFCVSVERETMEYGPQTFEMIKYYMSEV